MSDLSPWDYVVINGQQSPDLANVAITKGRLYKLDARGSKTAGQVGSAQKLGGRELAEWSVLFALYPQIVDGALESEDAVLERWTQWFSQFRYADTRQKGKDVKALRMEHPLLRSLGMAECLIKHEHGVARDVTLGLTAEVEFVEYYEVKESRAATKPADGIKPIEIPKDPVEEARRARNAQAAAEEEAARNGGSVSGQRGLTPGPQAQAALDEAAQ